jgi:glycyl-tRNA synthetase beta chain
MIQPLLIEIATEELPAIPFLQELPNIEKKWAEILEENNLLCEFEFYYTPRRLTFWHREFKVVGDDSIIEMFGAPVAIAYKDGQPTGAAMGFAKKCGVDISQITTKHNGKDEVLYFQKEQKGKMSKDLLNDMVNLFIKKLDFGKSMRWGSLAESFIRPIRGLTVLLGEELIDATLYGVSSSKTSFAHRMVSYEKFSFNNAHEYFDGLKNKGIVLYPSQRKEIILKQIADLEIKHNLKVELDLELLEEVVAITEYPTALLGTFDEEFLELPPEVIINSMKANQRYFGVYKDGKLANNFIVVSNAYTEDFSYIVSGNEKVLRPRLSDAMFFWKNDIKNGLSNERLKNITFVEGLGSLYNKCERETVIGEYLADTLGLSEKELLAKTIMISKADLTTDMVYEFTELQGLMGYYYASLASEDEKLCIALKEQYLPTGEESEIPSSLFSSIVALSNKIDNLLALFSVGMVPTGSRDPFALRRAAAGIVRICITNKYNLDIYKMIADLEVKYPNLDSKKVIEFFNDRLFKIFSDINPSVVKAVLASGEGDILKISQKIYALNPIVNSSDFSEFSSTFKRVANIIKDVNIDAIKVDTTLFEDAEEGELFEAYNNIASKNYPTYDEELEALFSLKPNLDKFFTNVFVNHENEAIKQNRRNLIGLVYKAFRNIADIKEITI